ncbi:MAG TPA: carboxypeptidase regulatory-like domain-containing protein [Pyrinomonadaceae bacterium]|nr:carboxypeptidase regulatory-like domain-containing protein [Pyrinomonadaceae bacterium]
MSLSSLRIIRLLSALMFCCLGVQAQNNPGKIVFADEFGRLLVINADGSGQTMLTQGGNSRDDGPAFSPDGSKIAFHRQILSRTDIFVMNADGTNPVALTSGPSPTGSAQVFNLHPTWSPDGTKLAFSSSNSGTGKLEIWVMNANGGGVVRLTTSVQVSADGQGPIFSSDENPAWSPDGLRIAFDSSRNGLSDHELYVMSADGTNQTRLTDNIYEDRFPTWSPDSQKIGFSGNGLHIMNRDGSNVVLVPDAGGPAAWSPDGSKFAYINLDPANSYKGAIYVSKIDGTSTVKITDNTFDVRSPSWAPVSSSPIPTFTISGEVKNGNGTPMSGVSLNLTGNLSRNTQTDAAGAYSFAGLPTGNYSIAISKSGFGFTPSSIAFNNLNSNQTANFTAFVAFSISGQLNGVGGNSLTVTLTGTQSRSVLTDVQGNYSFDLLPTGNYTVAIHTPIWNVTPASVTFSNLSANQIANFDAVRAKYSINGTITRLGIPKAGIEVQLWDTTGFDPKKTTTDANGHYSFTGVNAGVQYTVRPVGANFLFQPQTADYASLDGDKTADFIALSTNNLLFGRSTLIVAEGTPSLQLTVFRGGNASGVGPITVDYATADGTATAGTDYTAVSGTLSFPEGTFQQTVTIPLLNDQLPEGSEQFSISLSNSTGEVDIASPSTVLITILDNEPQLLTESNSDRAIAINATSFLAGPFRRTTELNFSTDTRTRLSLFMDGLILNPLPAIAVDAVDASQNHFQLPLEAVVFFNDFSFKQLIVRLPENLPTGELVVTVTVNGQLSNSARIQIAP